MVMRFRSGGEPSARFHLGAMPAPASAAAAEERHQHQQQPEEQPERTTWFTSSLELREGLEVNELNDDSIDRIVL